MTRDKMVRFAQSFDLLTLQQMFCFACSDIHYNVESMDEDAMRNYLGTEGREAFESKLDSEEPEEENDIQDEPEDKLD